MLHSSSKENADVSHLPLDNLPPIITQFENLIIQHIRDDMEASCFHCSLRSIDDINETLANLLAHVGSASSLLFIGLSLNEFNTGWYIYILAAASFTVNYVQMHAVDKISARRYLEYSRNFIKGISGGLNGMQKLLGVNDLPEQSQKIYMGAKSTAYFLLTEGLKWPSIYFASVISASLVPEVKWLNYNWFRTFVHAATMMLLEPSIHDRIHDITFPALTQVDIYREQIRGFRYAIEEILRQSSYAVRDNSTKAAWLANFIKSEISNEDRAEFSIETSQFSQIITNDADGNKVLSSAITYPFAMGLTFCFAASYAMSNAGNYRATWENNFSSYTEKVASILGDFFFGVFMALNVGTILARHRHRVKSISHNEWEKLLITVLSIGIAVLTVGTTLSVGKEMQMPLFIMIGTVLGTIFDNSNFLIETIFNLIEAKALQRNAGNSGRHQRAMVEHYYKYFRHRLNELSNKEFLEYIDQVLQLKENCLDSYLSYIAHKLPWIAGLSVKEVVEVFRDSPENAMCVINRNGEFGVKRKFKETLAAFTSALLICGSYFGKSYLPVPWSILCQWCVPVVAVPTGLALFRLFNCCNSQARDVRSEALLISTSESQSDNRGIDKSISSCQYITKILAAIGLPVALKYGAKILADWIFINIFDQSTIDANIYSEYASTAITTIAAGVETNSLLVYGR